MFLSEKILVRTMSSKMQWKQNGITIAGGNKDGNEFHQLYGPSGIYVDEQENIYVADEDNHRIVRWEKGAKSGQIVAGGYGKGNGNDQLSNPTKVIIDQKNDALIIADTGNKRVVHWPHLTGTNVTTIISNVCCSGLAMDNNGYLYVSDIEKHEVRRWKIGEKKGKLVAGGNKQGIGRDQLNGPRSIFVDQDYSVYVSDNGNHRVMKWIKGAKQGIIVAGGTGPGKKLTQLSYPYGIAIDRLGSVYVADCTNHRVMCWLKDATEGTVVVGGNDQGNQENQLNSPCDISFDQQNNLYVVDSINHRVQKFSVDYS